MDERLDVFAAQVAMLRQLLADIERLAEDGIAHENIQVTRAVLRRITDLLTVGMSGVIDGAAEMVAALEQHDRETQP